MGKKSKKRSGKRSSNQNSGGASGRGRPWQSESRPLNYNLFQHSETGMDGQTYQVRRARPAQKTYTCPGCFQTIQIGQESILAWPEADSAPFGIEAGVQARRHWHVHCWNRYRY